MVFLCASIFCYVHKMYQSHENCNGGNLTHSYEWSRLKVSLGFHEKFTGIYLIHDFRLEFVKKTWRVYHSIIFIIIYLENMIGNFLNNISIVSFFNLRFMPLFTISRDFIMIMWWLEVFCNTCTCIICWFFLLWNNIFHLMFNCRLLQSAVTLRRQWIKWLTRQQRPRVTWLWVGSTRVRGWSSPRADWGRWTCGNWTLIMEGGKKLI